MLACEDRWRKEPEVPIGLPGTILCKDFDLDSAMPPATLKAERDTKTVLPLESNLTAAPRVA